MYFWDSDMQLLVWKLCKNFGET